MRVKDKEAKLHKNPKTQISNKDCGLWSEELLTKKKRKMKADSIKERKTDRKKETTEQREERQEKKKKKKEKKKYKKER